MEAEAALNHHPEWSGLYEDGSLDLFNRQTPNPSQIAFCGLSTKNVMWGGAVRNGKTWALCRRLFALAWMHPNNFIVLGRWHKEHLLDSTLKTFMDCFPPNAYPIEYTGGIETDACRFQNGSIIKFVPLSDRKRWPGQEFGAFGIDQAEQCERKTWTDLSRRLCLMRVPVSSHFGLGVANFDGNWDWARDMFINKIGIDQDAHHLYEYMTSPADENDHNIPPNYRQEQIATMSPSEADRLMRGIDVLTVGRVFKKYDDSRHVKAFELETDVPLARFFISYDYGRGHPTAILLGAVDANGRHWIRAEHVEAEMDIPDHEMAVHRLALRTGYPLKRAMYPAGWDIFAKTRDEGRCIADEWSKDFPWYPMRCKIADRIERMSILLNDLPDGSPGLVIHPDCVNLRYEMSRYKYKDDGSGDIAKENEAYRHDTVDALGYFTMAALEPSLPEKAGTSILTSGSYLKMVEHQKRTGRRVGYWVPVKGGVDPAEEYQARRQARRQY